MRQYLRMGSLICFKFALSEQSGATVTLNGIYQNEPQLETSIAFQSQFTTLRVTTVDKTALTFPNFHHLTQHLYHKHLCVSFFLVFYRRTSKNLRLFIG